MNIKNNDTSKDDEIYRLQRELDLATQEWQKYMRLYEEDEKTIKMLQYNSYGDENREDGEDNSGSRSSSPMMNTMHTIHEDQADQAHQNRHHSGIMKDSSNEEKDNYHKKTVRVQSPTSMDEGKEGDNDDPIPVISRSARKSRIF